MRKQIFLALLLTFGLTAGGCAWFGGDTSSTEAAITPAQPEEAAEPAPAPVPPATGKAAAKADKKAAKTADKKPSAKGAKTEAQIAAELETVGRKLVAQAGRTVVPSKAKKDVRQVGKDFVASYVEVDESTISTELRPGASGQYVGFVRYKENVYECRGASRQAALTAACQQVKARRINELIRYDGSSWQY